MKAVVYKYYGPPEVLEISDIEKPIPKDNEVLVRVRATTVTIGDTILRSGRHPDSMFQTIMMHLFMGFSKPRNPILGMEAAGDIEEIGTDVTQFRVGDAVFLSTFGTRFGAYAEYKSIPENSMLAIKPVNLNYAEAAALIGGGITALKCLRKADVRRGQSILIYGASGAVGTCAVQLAAKHFRASVTGVCSTANLSLVMSLGADAVIDYTCEDIRDSGKTYDVVFDAVGKLTPSHAKSVLNRAGVYINVRRDSGGGENLDDLLKIKEIAERGHLKPPIDCTYQLKDIVDAHRYVEKGHKKGNVAVNIAI